jgi:hypothetical protein
MRTVEGLCHFSWALHCQMLKITERVVIISNLRPGQVSLSLATFVTEAAFTQPKPLEEQWFYKGLFWPFHCISFVQEQLTKEGLCLIGNDLVCCCFWDFCLHQPRGAALRSEGRLKLRLLLRCRSLRTSMTKFKRFHRWTYVLRSLRFLAAALPISRL